MGRVEKERCAKLRRDFASGDDPAGPSVTRKQIGLGPQLASGKKDTRMQVPETLLKKRQMEMVRAN